MPPLSSKALDQGGTSTEEYRSADGPRLNSTNRVRVVVEEVAWLVLPKMMQVATDIYEDVQRRKASKDSCPVQAPPAKKAKGGLGQRDPWCDGGASKGGAPGEVTA